ncbi:T-complex 11 [Penicillium chrysogenum]|uniref:T-complex 11 n=1 Tax=Penicillium chrysogenum TaxID=5076 RepID=A0ABQ8WE79_PENCH|nr:T-complex 11 [Penicillium chrysogenum]
MQDEWADCMVEQIEKGSFQEPREIANGIDPVSHLGRHGAGYFHDKMNRGSSMLSPPAIGTFLRSDRHTEKT